MHLRSLQSWGKTYWQATASILLLDSGAEQKTNACGTNTSFVLLEAELGKGTSKSYERFWRTSLALTVGEQMWLRPIIW